jgi:hypothetical protein
MTSEKVEKLTQLNTYLELEDQFRSVAASIYQGAYISDTLFKRHLIYD